MYVQIHIQSNSTKIVQEENVGSLCVFYLNKLARHLQMGSIESPVDFIKFITKSLLPFSFLLVFSISVVIIRQANLCALLLSLQTPCCRCSKGKLTVAQFEGPLHLPWKASLAGSYFPGALCTVMGGSQQHHKIIRERKRKIS